MKKLIVILLMGISPLLANADCNQEWGDAYDAAMNQYSADISYCSGRFNHDLHYSQCFSFAKDDLEYSLGLAYDSYLVCLKPYY